MIQKKKGDGFSSVHYGQSDGPSANGIPSIPLPKSWGASTKALPAVMKAGVAICKEGYVATGACKVMRDKNECLADSDIHNAYNKLKDKWGEDLVTFLQCGKLNPDQTTFVANMATNE